MSRQSPHGLPPRPSRIDYHGDSYRPAQQQDNYYPRQTDGRDMYQFRGNSYAQPPPPGTDRYVPLSAPPRGPAADSYRPQEGGFNFRFDAPPGVDLRQSDSYRPRSPPRQRNRVNITHSGSDWGHGSRGGYRGRAGPRLASDRAFLRSNRSPTPELMSGMDQEVKYKPIEDMSDSDETDMKVSEDDADQPRKKQARAEKSSDGNSVPRWSNPDPYTVLPPIDESQRKKKDVVKLIRKARVEKSATTQVEPVTDDFISFDFGDDFDDGPGDASNGNKNVTNGVPGAPTGPRYSHRENFPGEGGHVHTRRSNTGSGESKSTELQKAEAKKHSPLDITLDPALGNRKRTHDDEIKGPPLIHKVKKGRPQPVTGAISKEWYNGDPSTNTPWLRIDQSQTANMGVWLHKEIIDFYNHVKPRDFEHRIRTTLVEDLRAKVRDKFKDADIQCFGSYMAGLYLPTADMDLVCVSDTFMRSGRRVYGNNKDLFKFKAFLEKNNLPLPGSIEVISKAKVPLVKYVDRLTGLKVDISFENDTGLTANKTFQDWKAQFPAMPILVTLIKHFLAIRGLNEPVNGGIGGFSVTCLVVSLLQNMPQVQSRSMIPEHHLGEILMEFFDLYGNQFNVVTTAIQFDPPGYISKSVNKDIVYRQGLQHNEKFSIIDPNNRYNDVSGGSTNTPTIRASFSKAYTDLHMCMSELQHSKDRHKKSILGSIIAGNYSSFDLQRGHLAHIYEKTIGPISEA